MIVCSHVVQSRTLFACSRYSRVPGASTHHRFTRLRTITKAATTSAGNHRTCDITAIYDITTTARRGASDNVIAQRIENGLFRPSRTDNHLAIGCSKTDRLRVGDSCRSAIVRRSQQRSRRRIPQRVVNAFRSIVSGWFPRRSGSDEHQSHRGGRSRCRRSTVFAGVRRHQMVCPAGQWSSRWPSHGAGRRRPGRREVGAARLRTAVSREIAATVFCAGGGGDDSADDGGQDGQRTRLLFESGGCVLGIGRQRQETGREGVVRLSSAQLLEDEEKT